jgi:hypothetical protein
VPTQNSALPKTADWLAARDDFFEFERLMSAREHRITVRLNDQEAARLDELRGDEERPVYLRRLLYEPPKWRRGRGPRRIAGHSLPIGAMSFRDCSI